MQLAKSRAGGLILLRVIFLLGIWMRGETTGLSTQSCKTQIQSGVLSYWVDSIFSKSHQSPGKRSL